MPPKTSGLAPKVVSLSAARLVVNPKIFESLDLPVPPFSKAKLKLVIEGVPTACANAIRRVIMSELEHHCLTAKDPHNCITKTASSDPFVLDPYINMNIMCIPIRRDVPDEILDNAVFELRVVNDSETHEYRSIKSGDIVEKTNYLKKFGPIFNPNITIAILSPAYGVEIKDIAFTRGVDSKDARVVSDNAHAAFQPTHLATTVPLDIAKHTKKEMCSADGKLAFGSGYKESTFTMNPRKHKIKASIPITPAGPACEKIVRSLVVDTCQSIIDRLTTIRDALTKEPNVNVQLHVNEDGSDLIEGVLTLKYETHTIGVMIKRLIYELYPQHNPGAFYYTHNYTLIVRVSGVKLNAKEVFTKAVEASIGIYTTFRDTASKIKIDVTDRVSKMVT